MSKKPAIRIARRTVLVIVEGDTEFAFCLHLKANLSRGRNVQINIRNAHGGSPDKIVAFAGGEIRQASYDTVLIIFDTDRPLSVGGKRFAEALRAKLILFSPCIEAWFLRLLNERPPATTAACKRRFHEMGLDEQRKCERDAYERLFPAKRLRKFTNTQFKLLVKVFSND